MPLKINGLGHLQGRCYCTQCLLLDFYPSTWTDTMGREFLKQIIHWSNLVCFFLCAHFSSNYSVHTVIPTLNKSEHTSGNLWFSRSYRTANFSGPSHCLCQSGPLRALIQQYLEHFTHFNNNNNLLL